MDAAFLDELASSSPTPGGGGASAYVGAIAAALASMVGELTVGKKCYADVEDEVIGSLGRLSILRSRLIELIDEDAEAFGPLAASYKMPSGTSEEREAKNKAMQSALSGASDVPLEIMRTCIDVLHECEFLARHGSRMAISDAGSCAVIAKSAVVAASLNVYINANSMDDADAAGCYRETSDALIEEAEELADNIYAFVASEIKAPL